jgi:DNA-binding transcriptional regulator/RsmH inhibitor MraZ
LEEVGLVRDTVLVGTITAFHIWEPKRYAAFLAANPAEAADDTAIFQQFGL